MSNAQKETSGEIQPGGPFGNYAHGTAGAVLNAMVRVENVPLTITERVSVGRDWITYGGAGVGRYKWFDGIDVPLFSWLVAPFRVYSQHVYVVENGNKKMRFRPSLCAHESPALEVDGALATPALYAFLNGMLTNYMDDPRYKLSKDSGAFFQGGHGSPNGGWFLIEFWRPEGVKSWIDFVNEHYKPEQEDGGSFEVLKNIKK